MLQSIQGSKELYTVQNPLNKLAGMCNYWLPNML